MGECACVDANNGIVKAGTIKVKEGEEDAVECDGAGAMGGLEEEAFEAVVIRFFFGADAEGKHRGLFAVAMVAAVQFRANADMVEEVT